MNDGLDENGFETFGTKQTQTPTTSSSVLGCYIKTQPQSQGKPRSFVVNRRGFISGGINRGLVPYMLPDDQWMDSLNMVFDYDRAKALPGKQTVDQLVADMTNLQSGPVDDSVCSVINQGPPVVTSATITEG